MRFRVMFATLALLALTTLGLGQDPAQISFTYPGDWDCGIHSPLSYGGACFAGTPIPEGSTIEFYKNGSPHATQLFNSDFICGVVVGGFFATDYVAGYVTGDRAQLHVIYQGCHYWTTEYTLPAGATQIELYEVAWTCQCENPGCDVKEEQGGLLPGRSMEPAGGESDGLSDSGSGMGSAASSTVR